MTTNNLTEQGWYYVSRNNNIEMLEYVGDYFLSGDVPLIDDKDVSTLEVLAPVPSFEQWQQMKAFCEEFNALDVAEENQKLKELLKECRNGLEKIKHIAEVKNLASVYQVAERTLARIDEALK